jgi:hypothetical protein
MPRVRIPLLAALLIAGGAVTASAQDNSPRPPSRTELQRIEQSNTRLERDRDRVERTRRDNASAGRQATPARIRQNSR